MESRPLEEEKQAAAETESLLVHREESLVVARSELSWFSPDAEPSSRGVVQDASVELLGVKDGRQNSETETEKDRTSQSISQLDMEPKSICDVFGLTDQRIEPKPSSLEDQKELELVITKEVEKPSTNCTV